MWPGFDSRTRRHMWVEFVVGSRPCSERFFSGYSGFPLSSKTKFISLGLLRATQVKQRLFVYFFYLHSMEVISIFPSGRSVELFKGTR